jgi:hypothetical protein
MASLELADPDPCVCVLRLICEACSFCSGIKKKRLQSSICETKLCHKLCEAKTWTGGGELPVVEDLRPSRPLERPYI